MVSTISRLFGGISGSYAGIKSCLQMWKSAEWLAVQLYSSSMLGETTFVPSVWTNFLPPCGQIWRGSWVSFNTLSYVWSEMVPRVVWQGTRGAKAVEWARLNINARMAHFVRSRGGVVANHRKLEGDNHQFMTTDGVHLNESGLAQETLTGTRSKEAAARVSLTGETRDTT